MQQALSSRLRLVVIELWLAATTVLLLTAAASSLRDPALPIQIGLIDARGFPAVCATTLPAICGIVALMGLFQRRASATISLLLYSLFWLVILGGGMLAAAWTSGLAGMAHLDAHTWIVGGVTFATMIACFLIMAHWSLERLSRRSPGSSAS